MAFEEEKWIRTQSVHQQLVGTLSAKDAQDIQDMLKDLLERNALQGMLEAEMDDHLGYSSMTTRTKRQTIAVMVIV